jgi:hypothetical protein
MSIFAALSPADDEPGAFAPEQLIVSLLPSGALPSCDATWRRLLPDAVWAVV